MSQRLAAKTTHLPDKKSANIDKIIGLSKQLHSHKKHEIHQNIFRNILSEEILPVSLHNENSN